MSNTILLMRHGETEWNRWEKKQGQKDSPLTKKGLLQAKELAKTARLLQIDYLFTSPLKRALQTALVVEKAINLKHKIDKRLMECSFGICEGLFVSDINHLYPSVAMDRKKDPWNFQWPKGESYADIYIRASNFIADLFSLFSGKTIAVVAHVMINKTLIGKLLNLSPQEILRLYQSHNIVFCWQKNQKIKYLDTAEKSLKWHRGLIYRIPSWEK